jgi:hypothetical protein
MLVLMDTFTHLVSEFREHRRARASGAMSSVLA